MPELVSYTPPGEVAREFNLDTTFVRGIKGPVGSGKSSSCCWDVMTHALTMTPDRKKRRRSRWGVIRNTYGELKNTTIKTWMDWFSAAGTIRWDAPITFQMHIKNIGDGTSLDLEVIFLALDTPETVGKLKSFELSGAWINEASETPKEIMDMLTQRVGRFPAKKEFHGCIINGEKFNADDIEAPVPYWTGVIMDTNPPDDDHWWYRLAEEEKPDGFRFFNQPGGLLYDEKTGKYSPNPMAENVQNIAGGYEYYFRQISGKNLRWIKVYLLGQYGQTLDGKVVYPEWNDNIHLAKETIKPITGRPIILSFDYGLTPSCLAGQMDARGRVLILREWCAEDMGIRQFYSEVVRPEVLKDWKSFRIEATGDPAGAQRSQTDEKSCMQELMELGLAVEPAITNEFLARRDAVAFFLTKLAGGLPGFMLDPSCKMLRKGFNGGYRYERLQIKGSEPRYKDRPVKDKFSHPHDALQYLCAYLRHEMNPVRHKDVKQAAVAW